VNAATLKRNDQLAVWINNNATKTQRFHAMQDSEYNNTTNTAYDQSLTISTALGSILGPLYVKGTESGKLPLVQKLINSSNGTAGAFVGTGAAKAAYSYPRPYLLLTAFPKLTSAQRTSVLAQTEIRSGYPLDATRTLHASWERLNLAAALSATVRINRNGSVTVLSTGGQPKVVKA
jgi:hypothetical protein